jgi:hypothetical protein
MKHGVQYEHLTQCGYGYRHVDITNIKKYRILTTLYIYIYKISKLKIKIYTLASEQVIFLKKVLKQNTCTMVFDFYLSIYR